MQIATFYTKLDRVDINTTCDGFGCNLSSTSCIGHHLYFSGSKGYIQQEKEKPKAPAGKGKRIVARSIVRSHLVSVL